MQADEDERRAMPETAVDSVSILGKSQNGIEDLQGVDICVQHFLAQELKIKMGSAAQSFGL